MATVQSPRISCINWLDEGPLAPHGQAYKQYQDLKQDFGLGHYEGRGWRGFHHHASLSIAAYGFLMAERLFADKTVGGKKNFAAREVPALPDNYIPRGSPARAAARRSLDHNVASSSELRVD